MNGFLNVKCGSENKAYTRIGKCAAFEGTPKALIFTAAEEKYLATSAIGFTTALDLDLATGKAFAITEGIVNLEPSGGETRVSQEGFGPAKSNGWEPYSEIYTINKGGFCLLKQLLKVDGDDLRVFLVDDRDVVYGEAADAGGSIRGYKVNFGVSRRANTGSEGAAIRVALQYSLDYLKEMTRVTTIEYVGDDILTVIGITLVGTSTTKQYALADACSGEVLSGEVLNTLAPATNLKAYIVTDGVVTKDLPVTYSTNDEFITIDGAVAGKPVGLYLVNPSAPLGTAPLVFGLEDTTVIAHA